MKIIAICSTYNEQDFLPLKIQWAKANGLELYVCDNNSTDGTDKILHENKIQHHHYDTGEIFSITMLDAEINRTLARLRPDWVVYQGADLFMSTGRKLRDEIEWFDKIDSSGIHLTFISMRNTGERRTEPFNPFRTFRHYHNDGALTLIFRWTEKTRIEGDNVIFPEGAQINQTHGLIVNYGDTKTATQRMATLERRKKAWALGEALGWGHHLRDGHAKNWTWKPEELKELDGSIFESFVNHIEKTAIKKTKR